MDVVAELVAPCTPDELFVWVEDLDRYAEWLEIVDRSRRLDDGADGEPSWSVDLRGRIGPLSRSKRLRMVRTRHDAPKAVTFERLETDGRQHSPWRLHAEHTRHSLINAFYQVWDLHPAQLVPRYATVYAFFLEGLDAASNRLHNFMQKAAQATLVGDIFDDAATGQGLLNFFLRAMSCGAISEQDTLEKSGLTLEELRGRSFVKILAGRKG